MRRSRSVRSLTLAIILFLAVRPALGAQEPRDTILAVPITDANGQNLHLVTRLCRPAGDAPARLVVINHGSPPDAAARPRMRLMGCDAEAVRWFVRRGYAVALPLRRGYGATGGVWSEGFGGCTRADYFQAGLETARDIAAVVDSVTELPFVRGSGAVVVGQSAGGWGAIAYDCVAHPKVAAFIVMAGGRGGHQYGIANRNCRPDRLADAAGRYGATATTPMLWIYAVNDSFFAPSIARALYQAFTAAGGRAELAQPRAFDEDGHRLFFGRGGSAIWGPLVDAYLARQLPAGR